MLMTIVMIVSHTPLWVWALYAGLLFLGFQRTRDSSVPLYRVLILPLIVTVLAVSSVIGEGTDALPAMLVGGAAGSAIGWYLEREGATRRLPGGRIWARGEWWSFWQLVMVLMYRYVTIVAGSIYPALDAQPAWHLGVPATAAALSGLFVGRTAARVRVYLARAEWLA